ncbi:phage virion morphogenesis protein [Amniculibacterium sp. G2-70]|uniref:phage virion morphogenesis protein n=1 Tax=Amniculibacterium sp. G2-70 TaxID=2767188 RepID=UPI001654BF34|nr:phage virion morphogenesis protein [Amniculibacterium sp. G2-70]
MKNQYIEFKTEFFNRLQKVNKPSFMRRLVNRAGVVAVNFSKERFVKKDWLDGSSRQTWEKRKRKDKGSLMVRSGRLKRSIRKLSEGDYFVFIGTDVPYAKAHNEGENINKVTNVRSHTRKKTIHASMNLRTRKKSRKRVDTGEIIKVKSYQRKMNIDLPKRQFLGDSNALAKRIERFANVEINNAIEKP